MMVMQAAKDAASEKRYKAFMEARGLSTEIEDEEELD
jgi:hypothetical protein